MLKMKTYLSTSRRPLVSSKMDLRRAEQFLYIGKFSHPSTRLHYSHHHAKLKKQHDAKLSTGHRTSDIGHRTSDIGPPTSL
jgi:hypothetical protein